MSGRPRPPYSPPSGSGPPTFLAAICPYPSEKVYAQATQVAVASTASAEDLAKLALQEEAITMVELGIVVDVDFAKRFYYIPEAGEIETPR